LVELKVKITEVALRNSCLRVREVFDCEMQQNLTRKHRSNIAKTAQSRKHMPGLPPLKSAHVEAECVLWLLPLSYVDKPELV